MIIILGDIHPWYLKWESRKCFGPSILGLRISLYKINSSEISHIGKGTWCRISTRGDKSMQNQKAHGMWGGFRNCKHRTANKILASILTMVGMAR